MAALNIEPGTLDIQARQGKTWTIYLTVRDSTGALVNLNGYSARWQARDPRKPGKAVLDLGVGTGITITPGAVERQITIIVSATTTSSIPALSYRHEVELTEPGGAKPPFLSGILQVTGEVVR